MFLQQMLPTVCKDGAEGIKSRGLDGKDVEGDGLEDVYDNVEGVEGDSFVGLGFGLFGEGNDRGTSGGGSSLGEQLGQG